MTGRRKPVPAALSQARAYWRLAAKAERAGQYAQADSYRKTADRRHAEYLRNKAHQDRLAQMRKTSIKP
jgi:hypothetical protein